MFFEAIDYCFSDLAFLGPGSGGPTIELQILTTGSYTVQIHRIRTKSFKQFNKQRCLNTASIID
jgi:hypothetical protein